MFKLYDTYTNLFFSRPFYKRVFFILEKKTHVIFGNIDIHLLHTIHMHTGINMINAYESAKMRFSVNKS